MSHNTQLTLFPPSKSEERTSVVTHALLTGRYQSQCNNNDDLNEDDQYQISMK